MTVSGFFGGSANLMQGLVSSLLGGVIAALTAYLVVRLTRRHEAHLALLVEARKVVAEVAELTIRTMAPSGNELQRELANKAMLAASLAQVVDGEFAQQLRLMAADLAGHAGTVRGRSTAGDMFDSTTTWLEATGRTRGGLRLPRSR